MVVSLFACWFLKHRLFKGRPPHPHTHTHTINLATPFATPHRNQASVGSARRGSRPKLRAPAAALGPRSKRRGKLSGPPHVNSRFPWLLWDPLICAGNLESPMFPQEMEHSGSGLKLDGSPMSLPRADWPKASNPRAPKALPTAWEWKFSLDPKRGQAELCSVGNSAPQKFLALSGLMANPVVGKR